MENMKDEFDEGLNWKSREDIDLQYIPEYPAYRCVRITGCFSPKNEGKALIETTYLESKE